MSQSEDVDVAELDDLFEYGVTELFRDVAAHAVGKLGLGSRFAHPGATSFSFHGEYDSEEEPEDGVIRVQQGYSFDPIFRTPEVAWMTKSAS